MFYIEKQRVKENEAFTDEIKELKEKISKQSRQISKHKTAKEEVDIKLLRAETEIQSYKTLLNEKNREYKDVLARNEVLEEKNAKLRKEAIRLVKERNEADTVAKEKNFNANVKSEKIRVLKNQLKDKKPKKKVQPKLDPEKDYLKDLSYPVSSFKGGLKATSKYPKSSRSRISVHRDKSSSGVSDIDEAEYYDSQFDRYSTNNEYKVTLPKIMGRSGNAPTSPTDDEHRSFGRSKVYKSLVNLNDPDDLDLQIQ